MPTHMPTSKETLGDYDLRLVVLIACFRIVCEIFFDDPKDQNRDCLFEKTMSGSRSALRLMFKRFED